MLPGGLSVVGMFVIAPPDAVKAAQAQLRQVITGQCNRFIYI